MDNYDFFDKIKDILNIQRDFDFYEFCLLDNMYVGILNKEEGFKMDNYEFVEEIKKILKIDRELDFIEIFDLGALYEKVWYDGYDGGIEEGYTAK
jgi:hypothetical protein